MRAMRNQFFALWLAGVGFGVAALASSSQADDYSGDDQTFLRLGYQYGAVLPSNEFVKGENARGEPIERFNLARLEFGWQTDGSEDWHHLYNFPTYGLGFNGGNYFNEDELGKPTSLYGFFGWPVVRWGETSLNIDLGFGLADNWVSFDELENPYNVAIGAARSVYIDVGASAEIPLTGRWWLRAGVSGTHYSNGGSQQPNSGINQIGPVVSVSYGLRERRIPAERRDLGRYEPRWVVSTSFAIGVRNLAADLRDDPQFARYLTRDYTIANLTFAAARQFHPMSRGTVGLDVEYDETVHDLAFIEDLRAGREPRDIGFGDRLGLNLIGGYEHVVARTSLLIHMGYSLLRKDVDGRLPAFFQRLGLRHRVYDRIHLGLNVRFHEFSKADNLEFHVGYDW